MGYKIRLAPLHPSVDSQHHRTRAPLTATAVAAGPMLHSSCSHRTQLRHAWLPSDRAQRSQCSRLRCSAINIRSEVKKLPIFPLGPREWPVMHSIMSCQRTAATKQTASRSSSKAQCPVCASSLATSSAHVRRSRSRPAQCLCRSLRRGTGYCSARCWPAVTSAHAGIICTNVWSCHAQVEPLAHPAVVSHRIDEGLVQSDSLLRLRSSSASRTSRAEARWRRSGR